MGQNFLISGWASEYWGRTGFLILFIGVCIYFFIKSTADNKKGIILVAVLIWIMSYSNSAVKIAQMVGYYSEWYRMFWILPVVPVVASGFVSLVTEQKRGVFKVIVVVLLVVLVTSTSVDGLSNRNYSRINSDYGINGEYIVTANIIKLDGRAEEPHVACDRQAGIEMRLWDPSIFYSIERFTHYYINECGVDGDFDSLGIGYINDQITLAKVVINGRTEDERVLLGAIEAEGVDYLVIKKDKLSRQYFEEMDIEYCGSSGGHDIYYCGMHK